MSSANQKALQLSEGTTNVLTNASELHNMTLKIVFNNHFIC
jgi:hypothetical protein